MSSPVRIGLVAEGITDYVVLNAAIDSMLAGRPYDLKLLQPEESVAFTGAGDAGQLGGGWKGVFKWCQQAIRRNNGHISNDILFNLYDVLILHLDADVAGEQSPDHGLPCEKPCPLPCATTDPLRAILLHWAGEQQTPPKTVLCTPSKSTEAWVMYALFPNDREMKKKGWECHPYPEGRLAQQQKQHRIAKNQRDYERRAPEIRDRWGALAAGLTEAHRFQQDFISQLA